MKRLLIACIVIGLTGCADRPFVPTSTIYNHSFTKQTDDSTHIRVHRIKQLTGSGLGEDCPLVLKVDDIEVAGLQQNQYIDFYLTRGEHDISVRFSCALTAWKKSLTLNADGKYREYQTELGTAGQYRLLQIN
ncbi:hypothetical protein RHD99_05530 [Buttiauxella selenatireducens]|uniref:Lipoprotein n=1 Tax=Buttiauxella selenatireducens TaxID=3073902 RepID=A0ABY9SEZ5_9ENTR|nr:hypothetical protein [Buttiauxella sp. R73]WMY75420.1 hypothetical protein RHD99_05530 [Buttiauxella sp. R73]